MSDARYPLPDKTTQTGTAWLSSVEDGLKSVETFFSGSTDPSSGHGWGATQFGKVWKDTTDTLNPVWKEWALISTGPDTYGWRVLSFRKVRRLTAPSAALTFAPASPAAADVAYTALDLTTLLDTIQDGGDTKHLVAEVILRLRIKADAAETLGSDDGYFGYRPTGSTIEQRVYAPRDGGLGGRYEEREITVALDANESFDWTIKVGRGTPSFAYEAYIVGFTEPC